MNPANIDPNKIHAKHHLTASGEAAEGITWGRGFHICWRSPASLEKVPDGAATATVIKAAKDRLEFCNQKANSSKYAAAILHLEAAIKALE